MIATAAAPLTGLLVALAALATPAAAETAGQPKPWQLGLQEAATPVMEQIQSFHNLLLVIITVITIFVLALLLYVSWRFHEKRNPNPSKTSHNTLLEIVWTAVPVIILVVIAIPSFKLLYYEDQIVDSEMTVKAIGRQWYWSYAYPDHGDFQFDSFMKPAEDLGEGDIRQLSVDNPLVLPAKTNIRIQITASDVLHSFAMPSFGIKTDAVPGQLNETWARIKEPGMYYGQCSEICGTGHADMPIAVKVLPKDEFESWIETQQAKHGITPDNERQLADANAGKSQ
jgi:cytochrome c oxidase subunit 2